MLMVTGKREEEIFLDYPKQSLNTGYAKTHPPKMTNIFKVQTTTNFCSHIGTFIVELKHKPYHLDATTCKKVQVTRMAGAKITLSYFSVIPQMSKRQLPSPSKTQPQSKGEGTQI